MDHPLVGAIEFDCDILEVPAGELHVVVYSAAPGSQDDARMRRLLPRPPLHGPANTT